MDLDLSQRLPPAGWFSEYLKTRWLLLEMKKNHGAYPDVILMNHNANTPQKLAIGGTVAQ